MSKSKIVGMTVLIAFAMGILLVGDVVAGEKVKGRNVWYGTKWEQINVPGEEKHLMGVSESKAIATTLEGKAFNDGLLWESVGLYDVDLKAETGSAHGYTVGTDRDGDKIYCRWEGRPKKGKDWGTGWEYKFNSIIYTGNCMSEA